MTVPKVGEKIPIDGLQTERNLIVKGFPTLFPLVSVGHPNQKVSLPPQATDRDRLGLCGSPARWPESNAARSVGWCGIESGCGLAQTENHCSRGYEPLVFVEELLVTRYRRVFCLERGESEWNTYDSERDDYS